MRSVLILLSICLLLDAYLASSVSNEPYSYALFEQEWANTVCMKKSCTYPNSENHRGKSFNVHGLWPNGKSDDICYHWLYCSDVEYDESQINDDLLSWLQENQVSLYHDSKDFREHEFEKHGSCYNYKNENADNAEKINEYFGKIRELAQYDYNLIEALTSNGVVPSMSKSYSLQQIKDALAQHFGTVGIDYVIKCDKGNDGKSYLKTIDFCVDNDYNIMECPCAQSACKKDAPIYFPSEFPVKGLSMDYEEEQQQQEQEIVQEKQQLEQIIYNFIELAENLYQQFIE